MAEFIYSNQIDVDDEHLIIIKCGNSHYRHYLKNKINDILTEEGDGKHG